MAPQEEVRDLILVEGRNRCFITPTNILFNRVQKADDSYLKEWMKGESNL